MMETMYERVSVKKAKLEIIPKVIPNGFLCPPCVLDDRIIGSKGQIQGAAIVTNPDKKAKTNSTIIL